MDTLSPESTESSSESTHAESDKDHEHHSTMKPSAMDAYASSNYSETVESTKSKQFSSANQIPGFNCATLVFLILALYKFI